MFTANAFLSVAQNLEFLPSAEHRNCDWLLLIAGKRFNGLHLLPKVKPFSVGFLIFWIDEGAHFEVVCCDSARFRAVWICVNVDNVCDLTLRATALAIALLGTVEAVRYFRDERAEGNAVCNKFIGQRRSVQLEFAEFEGKCRDLGDHDAAESVCKRRTGVLELKLDKILLLVEI